ncbi:hypothetical protein PLICRDRAFT_32431 [Plicaturopsis crispa FD-325 SS-3]|uniref:DUF4139 domain-containing protein n=1 Tax=Plicaturopsis crispa FD-325 SS-3 TaxID=944288 RepID=A0A0C9T892_PLICR|nr:hypothetical protein PLICRDRAFT_32431 [Plicaturopsis crispa FD-325 SS-3]
MVALEHTVRVNAPEHAIKAVTVFKFNAEVTRTFSLDLKAGHNKVEIKGLPTSLDSHSVRVTGLGAARLLDVALHSGGTERSLFGQPVHSPEKDSPAVRALRAKKRALESEKSLRGHEANVLVSYATTLSGEHMPPDQIPAFLDCFVQQGRKNILEVAELDEQIDALEEEIKVAAKKEAGLGTHVDITLGVDADTLVELKVVYIVKGAYWTPAYELYATTGEDDQPASKIALHYRARITQNSGEDWAGVVLTLSSGEIGSLFAPGYTTVPELRSRKIMARPQLPKPAWSQSGGGLFGQNLTAGGTGLFGSSNNPPQASGGFFGQSTQPQHSFGVFGSSATHSAPAGNLFGSATAQSTSSSAPESGLFQSRQDSAPDGQLPTTGGLFGSAITPQESQPQPVADSGSDNFEVIPSPGADFSEPTTTVTESPLALSYTVAEGAPTSIPSDNLPHQVGVMVLQFETNVTYVATPRARPQLYLQAKVKNTTEHRLLAGPVRVFLDGGFISATNIPNISAGDTFSCTLGVDSGAILTYSRTAHTTPDTTRAFSETYNTTTYKVRLRLRNTHSFALSPLVIRDALPTVDNEDKRVKVVLRQPSGLLDAVGGALANVDGQPGINVRWTEVKDKKGGVDDGHYEWVGSEYILKLLKLKSSEKSDFN